MTSFDLVNPSRLSISDVQDLCLQVELHEKTVRLPSEGCMERYGSILVLIEHENLDDDRAHIAPAC